jgi:serine protease Do
MIRTTRRTDRTLQRSTRTKHAHFSAGITCMALLVGACGGGSGKSDPTTPSTVAVVDTASVAVVPDTAAPNSASGLEGMKAAVVQILAEGEIRDPGEGQNSFKSTGSGFFITADGKIVTNNHVVTGAGALTVLIGGDDDTRYPARVLGVSECSDLAVIELVDAGQYPFLPWSTKDVQPPLEVYAAGFPLGDPEYTVTRGVVSKAKADGDTSWASVRHVIEHDANIQPGNSGGPLVDNTGALVGVNYAGGDPGTGTAQFFAIAQDLAQPLINDLESGNKETIGVNGRAFVDKEAGLSGVWVRGVTPGGPASKAGIKPGDIITTLNGVDLGGGSLAPYCRVLRSAQPSQAMSVRIIRFDTKEVLEGELFGKELKPVFSFAQQLQEQVPTGSGSAVQTSGEFVRLTDESNKISVEVPTEWKDVNTSLQDLAGLGTPQPTIIAAPNIAKFDASDGPGIGLVLLEIPGAGALDKDELLKGTESTIPCSEYNYADYKDSKYSGRFFTAKCKDTLGVVAIVSPVGDNDKVLLIIGQAATEADLVAIDKALSTFEIR